MSPRFVAVSEVDAALVLRLLAGVMLVPTAPPEAQVVCFPGVPVPWQRARSRGTVIDEADGSRRVENRYFPTKETRLASKQLGDVFMLISPRPVCFTNLAVVCVFYLPDRRIVDDDNLRKLVADAGTRAGVWQDDSQITASAVRVELDAANPRTLIAMCPTTSSLDRTIPVRKRRDMATPLHKLFHPIAGR